MEKLQPKIEVSWKEVMQEEFEQPYFHELKAFLIEERSKYTIYPPGNQIFEAFNHTPFHEVKVVIIGQDPYHGPGQAHGLCFSVPNHMPKPPSLINIFKELRDDLGIQIPNHGNLTNWARQGVLLLNATLTVRAGMAGSHQQKGWERFTDKAIYQLAEKRTNLVFLLWGSYAIAKSSLIKDQKHCILTAPHPSPLSASRGFFGCRHFSKANNYLIANGLAPINWGI